ncbi:MAG: phospholipase D-like domain-containing protein [Planctomycetota bacterium]
MATGAINATHLFVLPPDRSKLSPRLWQDQQGEPSMDRIEISKILRATLDDHRMSRGEKQALRARLEELHASRKDLNVVRAILFDVARDEAKDQTTRDILGWAEEAVKVLDGMRRGDQGETIADAAFTPGRECLKRVTGFLASAQKTCDICVFTITDDRIARAIEAAHRRGVSIRIITDDEKALDLGTDIPKFKKLGIPVVTDHATSHMHHKFAVIDKVALLSGSFNWTRSASEVNQENVLITSDPRLVAPFATEFDRLWVELPKKR